MDPQQRLVLETSREAVERAGIAIPNRCKAARRAGSSAQQLPGICDPAAGGADRTGASGAGLRHDLAQSRNDARLTAAS
ncbi:beta-ketoacyl synthase N-terminal-like domain-containing protein [Streptomyces longwoodensis]|uniref:beta-ketoacyl synthase N-terminal-like domain-containing protein n=1 Tax=Streptomyces longwoodensis TaxID=68231 RepID=UPI003401C375